MFDLFKLLQVELPFLVKSIFIYLVSQAGIVAFVVLLRRVGRVIHSWVIFGSWKPNKWIIFVCVITDNEGSTSWRVVLAIIVLVKIFRTGAGLGSFILPVLSPLLKRLIFNLLGRRKTLSSWISIAIEDLLEPLQKLQVILVFAFN